MLRRFREPIPYRSSLDTPLLRFSGGDKLTIRDAVSGIQVFGQTGSGKTSGSGRALALAYLRSGMGGLVCCAKPEEARRWERLAAETGRSRDLIIFDDSLEHRFNFLDYAQATFATHGFELNLVQIMGRVVEAARLQRRGGSDGDNQFFRDAAEQLLANAFPFLARVYGTIRLNDLYRFINSAPATRAQAMDPKWQLESFCSQTLIKAGHRAEQGDPITSRICEQHGDYWLDEFPGLGDRTRGSVVTTLTSSIYPFLSGSLHELFCTDTTLVPELSREGAIIVLDIPTRKNPAGVIAQQIFKLLWQLSMESEQITKKTRPVFCWVDECQFFMNSYDTEHLSVCREQKVCNVFITQDMPTYYARLPSEKEAEALLNKFGVRIFHATTDAETARYASEVIGKVTRYQTTETITRGVSTGGGMTLGDEQGTGSGNTGRSVGRTRSRAQYQDYDIRPDFFGRELRVGGKDNRYRVDGIVIRNGSAFRSSRSNRIKAEFRQR